MFRAGTVALQKYVAPASTPSRQVFDIVMKSGPISATEVFAKAKQLTAPEGTPSVRSKTLVSHLQACSPSSTNTPPCSACSASLCRMYCPLSTLQARQADLAVPCEQDVHQGAPNPRSPRRQEAPPALPLPCPRRLEEDAAISVGACAPSHWHDSGSTPSAHAGFEICAFYCWRLPAVLSTAHRCEQEMNTAAQAPDAIAPSSKP